MLSDFIQIIEKLDESSLAVKGVSRVCVEFYKNWYGVVEKGPERRHPVVGTHMRG